LLKDGGLAKRYKFNQKEFKIVPKKKGLAIRYKFSQEELKVVPKGKGLAKKSSKLCQKEKV